MFEFYEYDIEFNTRETRKQIKHRQTKSSFSK